MSITQEDTFDLTAWVQSLNAWADGLGNTHRSCQQHESLTLHDFLSTGHHLLVVSFITSLKSKVCTALTTCNTAVNNCIILHAQTTTTLWTEVFWTGIHQSLFSSEGQSAFGNAGDCQGQLQTSRSLSLLNPLVIGKANILMKFQTKNVWLTNSSICIIVFSLSILAVLKEILYDVTQHFWGSSKTIRDHATDISFHTFQFSILFSYHMSL
jgi:hypothetical protein